MAGGTEEHFLLWMVCKLHMPLQEYRCLPAGEKELYRLLYDAAAKGGHPWDAISAL